jgi:hypothetical protein
VIAAWEAGHQPSNGTDAAFLHVYGLAREEAEHVLDSFPLVRKYDERDYGEYRTKRLVLEAYDRMATSTACPHRMGDTGQFPCPRETR